MTANGDAGDSVVDFICQWNHRVHAEWGKQRLHFWKLRFSPTYNREEAVHGLREVLRTHNVTSYVIYELIGDSDILLRIWIPTSVSQQDFEDSLVDSLRGRNSNLQVAHPFVVNRPLLHWVWTDGAGRLREPPPDVLSHPYSRDEIAKVDSNGGLRLSEYQRLDKLNLLTKAAPSPGVLFFTIITSPSDAPFTLAAQRDLEKNLSDLLLSCERVVDISFYSGSGFGKYLIAGRAPNDDFFAYVSEVIERINTIGIQNLFQIRTYTLLSASQDYILFDDQLASQVAREDPIEIEELLEQDESQFFEVKASAFVDVSRWLHNGGVPVIAPKITDDGAIKAIVGFLNADGGSLLIGALEARRVTQFDERLGAFPRFGEYVCIGLEMDFANRDWDAFQLRLQETISSRISPAPGPWITLRRESFQGVDLCVVSVRRPESHWFYGPGNKFWVRQGGRTIELQGVDADTYRAARGRT